MKASYELAPASPGPVAGLVVAQAAPGRSFQVLLGHKERVDAALQGLAKRAARKGLPPVEWTWGKAYTQTERLPGPDSERTEQDRDMDARARVTRVPLTIVGDAPHFAGWTFVAALSHLDGENIVRTVQGQELPASYRTRGPVCDHCRQARRRNETYVLRHEDGRLAQVGSTCIGDFLGSADASKIAARATMFADACGLAEDGCEGFGGGGSGDVALDDYLSMVACVVRLQGWTSRTAARERASGRASADAALVYLRDSKAAREDKISRTQEDAELAQAAEAWAEALTDAEVDAERGDYLHNLRAVARSGIVSFQSAGIAASTIIAYQRAIGRARAKALRAALPVLNSYVGTPGKRETWDVVLDFVTGYEGGYGYVTVLKFRTPEGATLCWKASNTDLARSDVGKAYALTGTVKSHKEYKGAKQTLVSRCRLAAK